MRQFAARLAPQAQVGDLCLLAFSAEPPPLWRAGQMAYLRVAGSFDPYLRRAYFPLVRGADVPPALLLPSADPLARAAGLPLDALAPVGNGFTLSASTRRLLLVAGLPELAPLLSLAHEATQRQIAVTLLVHAAPDPALRDFIGALLPLAVEYRLARLPEPALAEHLRWCDQVCLAGDAALSAAVRATLTASVPARAGDFAQALVAPGAGCGFGACFACALEMEHGMRLACVEGPVFDLFALPAAPA